MRSTYDEHGFAKNLGVGHGWVEGGPLLPVKTELYQTGLGIEALRALSHLAHATGKEEASKELDKSFAEQRPLMNETFWIAEKRRFAFALDKENQLVDEPSVLATVPMWFGLLEESKADAMITQLADLDHQTDWGMRIISEHSTKFSGGGYHYGSVWPLFTGWASVGEYRYHREFPAFFNLRSNALLGADGALGHFTEVLSGDYYQSFSTSSPHQIWSAAMVVSPILRGLFGLHIDGEKHELSFRPHIPADWTWFAIHNLRVGGDLVDIRYRKTSDSITLDLTRQGTGDCWLEFSPALSLRTQVPSVMLNDRPVPFTIESNAQDQHLRLRIPLKGQSRLVIHLKNDFGLSLLNQLPPLGSSSRELRIVEESWDAGRTQLTLDVSGRAGAHYELNVWNPSQIASVEGATDRGDGKLEIQMPKGDPEAYIPEKVVIHFLRR